MTDLALGTGVVLLAALVLADLLLSPRYVRRVRAALVAGDATARVRMYRWTVALAWAAAAVALAVLLGGGVSPADVGFRAPVEGSLGCWLPALAGAGFGLVASTVAARRGTPVPVVGDVEVMLPANPTELRWFAVVAVTAGVTEEVVYRALALTVLVAVLPGGRWPTLVVAAVLFGLGHAYQGRAGMLITAGLALVLGLLYLDTGSLLPGIVAHALLDLRALLLPTRSTRPEPADLQQG